MKKSATIIVRLKQTRYSFGIAPETPTREPLLSYGFRWFDQAKEINIMLSLDRRIIAAGFVALAAIAFVMAHGVAGDRNIYAVNTTVAQRAPILTTAMTVTVADTRDASVANVIAGSEPDPESFDQAGLESWWTKYQKAHPTR
jgi:hypothetical protein